MTENCQNYLSLGVVQNEKSVQAVLRCLSFFLGCRLFLNNIYLSIQALAALFCKTNVIFYKIQTLQNFVSLCNQTAVKICELFYEIFSIKLGFIANFILVLI